MVGNRKSDSFVSPKLPPPQLQLATAFSQAFTRVHERGLLKPRLSRAFYKAQIERSPKV
jgi:hypothetical protein